MLSTPRSTGTRTGLRRLGWLGPVLAALLVVVLAWWAYGLVHARLSQRTSAGLSGIVDTHVAVLRAWCVDHGGAEPDPVADARTIVQAMPAVAQGETGEVLVFDANAVLLAPSRFDLEAQQLGLPQPVDLRDPGGDLAAGHRPDVERQALPLTRMAARAISGQDGVDVQGYRNHLGVDVVGAWRWLDDMQIGVAAEVSVAEAYAPANVLLRAFWAIVFLSIAAGGVGVLVARRNAALARQVRAAEKKARTLGQYTLVKKIGEGGMGEVHLARHAMLRRPTAVKLLRPDRTGDQAIARFEREVQQTSRLTHPNTVQIFDFGRTPGGTFYYAMEYLVGVPLDEFVASEGPLPEGRVIYIIQQVCASLNEAHELGLVHRDIKPENIVLCRAAGAYDVVKVLDFGLVMDRTEDDELKLSEPGGMLGTPLYMSPEAFLRPTEVDARSDIYSLGAVAYFLLTGKPPFEGDTVVEIFNKQTKEKPVPPSERVDLPILPDIDHAVLACLAKDPGARPKSANALSREFEWCRSFGEWNRDKARYWWRDNETRLEKLFGLSSKAKLSPAGGGETIEIRLDGR